MARTTIYLDLETARRVAKAAKASGVSLSGWARLTVEAALRTHWPDNYFGLFGALNDSDVKRPSQPLPENDVPRTSV